MATATTPKSGGKGKAPMKVIAKAGGVDVGLWVPGGALQVRWHDRQGLAISKRSPAAGHGRECAQSEGDHRQGLSTCVATPF